MNFISQKHLYDAEEKFKGIGSIFIYFYVLKVFFKKNLFFILK